MTRLGGVTEGGGIRLGGWLCGAGRHDIEGGHGLRAGPGCVGWWGGRAVRTLADELIHKCTRFWPDAGFGRPGFGRWLRVGGGDDEEAGGLDGRTRANAREASMCVARPGGAKISYRGLGYVLSPSM